MSIDNLSEKEKYKIIETIKNGENLPKEFIYKLFADEEDVFLFWNGRNEEQSNVVLPFHSIEHIDEPRKEKVEGSGQLFDERGRQQKGWTNKLIWGDNKLILSSLVNGPLRKEIEEQGGLKLVYIDPPFAVGADFSFQIEINGEDVTKKQTVLEEIAYRDTWGKGISSYLNMLYERLKLIHNLLAEDGSIYVHCDWKINNYVKFLLDEIFDKKNFRNEIIWHYQTYQGQVKNYHPRKHDTIYFYAKSDSTSFELQKDEQPEKTIDFTRWNNYLNENNEITGANYPESDSRFKGYYQRFIKENHRKPGPDDVILKIEGRTVDSVWDIKAVDPKDLNERVDYPTQKPEKLIKRIIKASTERDDLVADFFVGSGTTAAVAEKLNRKWFAADLGRFAIHTTRKRMINVQRELKKEGKAYRAFEILNLGKYERQHFMGVPMNASPEEWEQILEAKQEKYLSLILEGYSAERVKGYKLLHGKKTTRFVHVGPLNIPVTRDLVESVYKECKEDLITQVDILGFEFEMGLAPFIEEEMQDKGVDIRLKNIPREVFDTRAVEKGQVKFYDIAYLDAKVKKNSKEVQVQLSDFVTSYTQDDLEEVENNLRKGSSKVVIENGEIWKVTKEDDDIYNREQLTESWADWIDYWAVDFNYESKKEIISIEEDGEPKERWSGSYIFENEWQSFRTKQDSKLELTSAPHTYQKPGRYNIMVKVVDILGVDTSQVFEVEV